MCIVSGVLFIENRIVNGGIKSDLCFAVVLSLLISGEGVEHNIQTQHDQQHGKDQLQAVCDEHSAPSGLTGFGFILTKIGYANIWPLFGSANQLLSALVLITLCVFTGSSFCLYAQRRQGL